MKKVYIGIDVHKESNVLALKKGPPKILVVLGFSIPPTPQPDGNTTPDQALHRVLQPSHGNG